MKQQIDKDLLALAKKFKHKEEILFLENSPSLDECVGHFRDWCVDNKVQYTCLYNISNLPFEYLKERIEWSQVIAFQSTFTYEIVDKLVQYISSLKDKKIIIQCYIHEPAWWYKPKGVKHDIYVLDCNDEDKAEWELKKLRLNKPIWAD